MTRKIPITAATMNAQIRDVREEKEDKRRRSEERNVETRAMGGGKEA